MKLRSMSGSPRSAFDASSSSGSYSAGSLGDEELHDLSDEGESDYSAGPLSPQLSGSEEEDEVSSDDPGSSSSSEDEDEDESQSSSEEERNSKKKKGKGDEKKKPDLATEICKTIREQSRTGQDVMRLIKERFESTDKDNDGYIDKEEFRALVKAFLGGREVTSDDAGKLMATYKIDTNGNGKVSYDEFVSFVSLDRGMIYACAQSFKDSILKEVTSGRKTSVAVIYERYQNKRGDIGPDDFRRLAGAFGNVGIQTMTDGELSGLMALIDRAGDGRISLSDLRFFLGDIDNVKGNAAKEGGEKKSQPTKAPDVDTEKDFIVVDVRLGLQKKKQECEELLAQGFTRLTSSLNDKGRGSNVHLFVKRANAKSFGSDEDTFKRARVTDLALSRSNKDSFLLMLGYQCVLPYQTNQGAWFIRKQYLWIRRNIDDKYPIVNIAVTSGSSKNRASKLWTPPYRGYKRIDGDLNAGNIGNRVFLWYFKENYKEENSTANPHAEFIKLVRNKFRDQLMENDDEDIDPDIDLQKLWEKYDRQGRGWITRARIAALIQSTGVSLRRKDLDKVIEILDVNHDNKIDKDEFMEFLAFNPAQVTAMVGRIRAELANRNIRTKSQLKKWFQGEGVKPKSNRNAKDFNKLLKSIHIRLTSDECKSLMGRFDRNGDGLINMNEFVSFMLSKKLHEEEVLSKKFVVVESAARQLRAFARNLASPNMNFSSACDKVFQNLNRLTKARLGEFLREELGLELGNAELAVLLVRIGTTRHKFIEFCTSSTYIDSVLNVIVEAAMKNTSIAKLFRQFDADGNGRLTNDEFSEGLKTLKVDNQPINLSSKELELIVQRFDQDGDGEVDIGEFLAFIQKTQRTREMLMNTSTGDLIDEEEHKLGDPRVLYVFAALRKIYQEQGRHVDSVYTKFDVKGSGQFTLRDLIQGLERLGIVPQEVQLSPDQLEVVFRRLDLQGRGVVNKAALQKFLKRTISATSPGSHASPKFSPGNVGRVSRHMLKPIRQKLIPIAQELEDECHSIDSKGSGTVPRGDFKELMAEYVSKQVVEFLTTKFASKEIKRAVDYEEFFEWLDGLAVNEDGDDSSSGSEGSWGSEHGSKVRSPSYSASPRSSSSHHHLSKRATKELFDYAKHLKSRFRSASALKKLLSDYATSGKLSREDFNDAMNLNDARQISKALWKVCFPDQRMVSINDVCHTLTASTSKARSFRSKRHSPRTKDRRSPLSSRSYHSEGSDSDGFVSSRSFQEDFELGEHEHSMLVSYISNALKKSAEENGFSWKNAVRLWDSDGSGTVKVKDLAKVLKAGGCQLTLDQLRKVANKAAALRNRGSTVNYEFFFAQVLGEMGLEASNVRLKDVETKIRNAFRTHSSLGEADLEAFLGKLDHNGDGRVSTIELARALPSILGGVELSPWELQTFLRNLDLNQDGKISAEEFINLFELKDTDIDDLLVKLKDELRSQARAGTSYGEKFQQFDLNGDGKLSRREFRKTLEQILPDHFRLSNNEMRKVMDRFDKGKTGVVDYHSFCEMCAPSEIEMLALESKLRDKVRAVSSKHKGAVNLKKAFELFDMDGNGKITRREFQQACDRLGLSLSEDELELLLRRFDTTGTGTVDYFEFCRFVAYDGPEVENLMVRAGKHLDTLQHDQIDPVASFATYEGRKESIGLISRQEFHRGCKDLKMPLSDPEIAALGDLFCDNQNAQRVKYRDFCLSCLSAAGAIYQNKIGGVQEPGHWDRVWNPNSLEKWLEKNASREQQNKFASLQAAMEKSYKEQGNRKSGIPGYHASEPPVPPSHKSQGAVQVAKGKQSGLWDCPVCFYKQRKFGRTSCEMCDSPCPSSAYVGQWPHIKPLLDDAYSLVGVSSYGLPQPAQLEHEELVEEDSRGVKHASDRRAPRWFSNLDVNQADENDSTNRKRSSRSRSPKKHHRNRHHHSTTKHKQHSYKYDSDHKAENSVSPERVMSPMYSPRSPRYY